MASVRGTPIGKSPLLPTEKCSDSALNYEDGSIAMAKTRPGLGPPMPQKASPIYESAVIELPGCFSLF
jgi:hypothetical protein